MLNIDAIHLREINMPLAQPFETSFGMTTSRRILLIELESEGLTGWGECVAGEHPYFSAETITTVGFGDFSFVDQPTWLRLFSVVLMFVGMATTADFDICQLGRRPVHLRPAGRRDGSGRSFPRGAGVTGDRRRPSG